MDTKVQVTFILGKQQATIKVFEGDDTIYIVLPENQWDYGTIVNAIIRSKYSESEVEALINNYLLDSEDEEIAAEMREFQAFRANAKTEAKACLEYAEENNLWAHQNIR